MTDVKEVEPKGSKTITDRGTFSTHVQTSYLLICVPLILINLSRYF